MRGEVEMVFEERGAGNWAIYRCSFCTWCLCSSSSGRTFVAVRERRRSTRSGSKKRSAPGSRSPLPSIPWSTRLDA